MSRQISVGMGDYVVLDAEEGLLVTFALGSCVAVILADTVHRGGAMIHAVMPFGENRQLKNAFRGYYVDTGLESMIGEFMMRTSASSENIRCWVIGGADSRQHRDVFTVGKRNVEQVKKLLSKYHIKIFKEMTGGYKSRTVYFDIKTKSVWVKQQEMII